VTVWSWVLTGPESKNDYAGEGQQQLLDWTARGLLFGGTTYIPHFNLKKEAANFLQNIGIFL
jgi:hypothetical protein